VETSRRSTRSAESFGTRQLAIDTTRVTLLESMRPTSTSRCNGHFEEMFKYVALDVFEPRRFTSPAILTMKSRIEGQFKASPKAKGDLSSRPVQSIHYGPLSDRNRATRHGSGIVIVNQATGEEVPVNRFRM